MQLDQPAALNRFVDPTLPLTWQIRWRGMRPGLPLLLSCCALLAEQVLFKAWLNSRDLIADVPLLLLCFSTPVLLVLMLFEVSTRITHHSKRKLKLDEKRIIINPAKFDRLAWQQVLSWRLEPVKEKGDLLKLTLVYRLGKKTSYPREWSMVLERSRQEQEFLSELEHLRQRGMDVGKVERAQAPVAAPLRTPPLRKMAAVGLGFYLFVHGLPLLGVGLLPPKPASDKPRPASQFSDAEIAKLARFVVRTFPSPEQFRMFLLISGGALTFLGAATSSWGVSSRHETKDSERPDLENPATVGSNSSTPHGNTE